jgi:iron-sulfur cluster repair protein YtfE (RIC family)
MAATADPIEDLSHDHADINRRLIALATQVRALEHHGGAAESLHAKLRELRELLFFHFAREEEGLFPFVRDTVPELGEQVQVMELAHDTICGSLARMVHLAASDAPVSTIVTLFDRFENAYAMHASTEAELLADLSDRLDADKRAQLARLVDGL